MNTNIHAVCEQLLQFREEERIEVETAALAELNASFEEFSVSQEALSSIDVALNDVDISDEALMDFFAKIGDTLLSLSNTFKTVVLKGGSRSEMRLVYERNTLQINRLESKSIADYIEVMVDVPTGMKGTYPQAVSVISDAYSALDMMGSIKNGVRVMDVVLSSMSKGSSTHENEVATANKILQGKLKNQETALKSLRKIFPDKGLAMKKSPIGQMVNSFEDLKSVRLSLLALEKEILGTIKVKQHMEEMAQSIALASEYVKGNMDGSEASSDYVPSKKFVKLLTSFVLNNAIAMSNYAEINKVHMATEHNVGLAYTTLLAI